MSFEDEITPEQEYYNKLKKGRKAPSTKVIVWLFSVLFFIILVTIGFLDWAADYTIVATESPVTITYTEDGDIITSTFYSMFGQVSYRNVERGFLPDFLSMSIHEWFTLALIVLIAIPSIFIYRRDAKRIEGIDTNLPYLLREIADSQRIGMTLPRAIAEAANRNYGPITPELKKLAAKISWGIPFSQAMRQFRDALDTPLARQATVLILEAERSGGELEKIFDSAQTFVQELLDIRQERANAIKPYMYIVFMSYVIFAIVIFVLFTTFFAPFGVEGIGQNEGGIPPIPLDGFKTAFLYLLVTQAFFSGLTAGKMATGKVMRGLPHAAFLMTLGLLIHKLLILPAVNAVQRGE